ncbi:hypothetical protein DFP72DRAFT_340769 [Ephemerocybe angulata]|uniref:Uncharacterized protein n=1 Tax=Ephemerocybe angulata TaxID=980116 RepID=A0A8H6I110_9AGAR|nr:hypothetical protein DFP72DRAFT_340769 [Tulosesus angulatus]
MPKSPQGIEAWIEVDGKRVDEYKVKRTPVECFIPCETGKSFHVVCSLPPSLVKKGMHMITVDMDGYFVYVPNNDVEKNPSATEMTTLRFEEAISCTCVRPLGTPAERAGFEEGETLKTEFSALEAGWCSAYCENEAVSFGFEALAITDDDAYLNKPTLDYGIIGLRIYSVARFSEVVTRRVEGSTDGFSTGWFDSDTITLAKEKVPDDEEQGPDGLQIHEAAKDHRTHGVVYKDKRANTKRVINLSPEGKKEICAIFFEYRHIDVLRAMGIAPKEKLQRPANQATASGPARIPPAMGLRSDARNEERFEGEKIDQGGWERGQSPGKKGRDGGELENQGSDIKGEDSDYYEAGGDQIEEDELDDEDGFIEPGRVGALNPRHHTGVMEVADAGMKNPSETKQVKDEDFSDSVRVESNWPAGDHESDVKPPIADDQRQHTISQKLQVTQELTTLAQAIRRINEKNSELRKRAAVMRNLKQFEEFSRIWDLVESNNEETARLTERSAELNKALLEEELNAGRPRLKREPSSLTGVTKSGPNAKRGLDAGGAEVAKRVKRESNSAEAHKEIIDLTL